jgi:2-phosphosulfolactate phosphatase
MVSEVGESMRVVNVEFTAKDAHRGVERGDVMIVVDVLRCTSSIVTALANGASEVTAVRSVSEARALKSKNPSFVLAGERGGLPPKGFELGNSPIDFSARNVKGRSVIITTTSGTQAINNASKASVVLMGSFLNLTVVARKALQIAVEKGCGLTVAMSGRLGSFSLEDFLCAGGIMSLWEEKELEFSDSAYASLLGYRAASDNLLEQILKGSHARELVNLGLGEDVAFCCERDKYDVVPTLKHGRIVRLEIG